MIAAILAAAVTSVIQVPDNSSLPYPFYITPTAQSYIAAAGFGTDNSLHAIRTDAQGRVICMPPPVIPSCTSRAGHNAPVCLLVRKGARR